MSVTLSTSVGSVTLKENFDAYEAGIDFDGPYVVKQYLAPSWPTAFPAINALRGSASESGGITIRTLPHICPESTNLYCMSASLTPDAAVDLRDSGRPTFNLPIITCRYGIPKFEMTTTDDPGAANSFPNESAPGSPYLYAMQSIDFDTEIIKPPGSVYKFSTAPQLPVSEPPGITVATARFVITLKYVPKLPHVDITAKMNRLNNATFLGQATGKIKFLNARTRREYLSDGTRMQEVELHFKWREYDHNKFHRPDESSFDFIVDSLGNKPYVYSDLSTLLR